MAKSFTGNTNNVSAKLIKGYAGGTTNKACKIVKGFIGNAMNKAQLIWSAIVNKVKWDTVNYIGTGYAWRINSLRTVNITVGGVTKRITGHTATSKAKMSENGLCTIDNSEVYKYDSAQSKYVRIIAGGALLNYIKTLAPFSSGTTTWKNAFLSGNGDELLVHVFVKNQGHGVVIFNIHEDGTWSLKKNHGLIYNNTVNTVVIAASIDLSIIVLGNKSVFMLDENDTYQLVTTINSSSTSPTIITIDKKFLIMGSGVYYINGTNFTHIGNATGTHTSDVYNPKTMVLTVTTSYGNITFYKLSETGITRLGTDFLRYLFSYDTDNDLADDYTDCYHKYADETYDGNRGLVIMTSEAYYQGDDGMPVTTDATVGIYEYTISRSTSGMITAMNRLKQIEYDDPGIPISDMATFAKYLNPNE